MDGTALDPSHAALPPGAHWRNWVGNQSFVPRHVVRPRSEDELAAAVAQAARGGLAVRAAGSGHSFTPVVATSGLLVDTADLTGLLHVDHANLQVSVAAGTKIGDVGRALKPLGLSLINQGDIDSQALAGALSTGTHGTGVTLGNMSSQIAALRLVTPSGDVLPIGAGGDAGLLHAAQVSPGLLGVVASITLNVTRAYNLRETLWRDDFAACLEAHDELARAHRGFQFFWCKLPESRSLYCLPDTAPVSRTRRTSDVCEMKTLDLSDEAPRDGAFDKVAYSSDIYPIDYVANFHELEYAVPAEHGKQALCEVRDLMLHHHPDCIYPVEYRFTAGDPALLSPFHQRDSVTISVSGGPGVDYWAYLRDVDAILRRYGSRPHWGKLHFLTAEDVPALYPAYAAFRAARRRLDPDGVFLNDHLRALFA